MSRTVLKVVKEEEEVKIVESHMTFNEGLYLIHTLATILSNATGGVLSHDDILEDLKFNDDKGE